MGQGLEQGRFHETGRREISPKEIESIQLAETALNAALRSAKIVDDLFHGASPSQLQIEYKEDATPKTIADVEGDLAIVQTIRAERPQDDIFIEESGYHRGVVDVNKLTGATHRWYADSLDGTRPFTENKPESTVGVVCCDENDEYLAAAIVHPGRKQAAIALRGMGAFIADISDVEGEFYITGKFRRLTVSNKNTFKGATVCVDSLFTRANKDRKHALMTALENLAEDESNGKIALSYDMTGSNIAYQLEVARGMSLLGITDAKGGNWDWRVGEAFIMEADGIMIDPSTGKRPTNKSEVMIYGNKEIVNLALPPSSFCYQAYEGFNK